MLDERLQLFLTVKNFEGESFSFCRCQDAAGRLKDRTALCIYVCLRVVCLSVR